MISYMCAQTWEALNDLLQHKAALAEIWVASSQCWSWPKNISQARTGAWISSPHRRLDFGFA